MRVIAKSTLARFWSEPAYADSKSALQSWHDETIAAPLDDTAGHQSTLPQREYLRQQQGGF